MSPTDRTDVQPADHASPPRASDLLQCTHEPNVSIPSLANLLIERAIAPSSSWVVVFKCLTTMHHLMCYGNERFSQYLASAPDVGLQSLSLQWTDRTNTPGGPEMAPFVRRYCAYILARVSSFRSVGYDFAKVKRAATAPPVTHRQAIPMAPTGPPVIADLTLDQVTTITPLIQTQIDSLLAFDARSATDLRNAVIRYVCSISTRRPNRFICSVAACVTAEAPFCSSSAPCAP